MHDPEPVALQAKSDAHAGPVELLKRYWLSIIFVVLLVMPLYVLLISVVVRSDLLRFWGDPFTTDQFKALFAFLGVALGVVATTLAALLTKANNDRALTQKEESERRAVAQKEESERRAAAQKDESDQRMLLQARESNDRQKLDTAIQVLNLIKNDDRYAGKAVNGAAIATLVVLGYPVIAMRTLQAAMGEGIVDSASAAWVIDQVLAQNLRTAAAADEGLDGVDVRSEPLPSREEAAQLLYDHVDVLTQDDGQGACDWPSCALGKWPADLSLQCGWVLMLALLKLLVSRRAAWWTAGDDTWSWVIYTLYQVTEEPTSEEMLKGEAATYALLLLDALDVVAVNGSADEVIQVDDLRHRLSMHTESDRIPSSPVMRRELEAWIREAQPR